MGPKVAFLWSSRPHHQRVGDFSDSFVARLYPFGEKEGRVRSSPVHHREVMMRTLPTTMLHLLNPFVPLFSRRLWPHVQVLLAGAFPQHRASEPLVPHYVSWVLGTPNSFSATIGSSTVPPGRAGRRVVCCLGCW
jgi:hypothetical protein